MVAAAMLPTPRLFRSRWAALLWAGGILWFAYDVAGSGSGTADGNAVATDATGAIANADDLKALANVIAD